MYLEQLYEEVVTGNIRDITVDCELSKSELTTWLDRILTSGHNISDAFIRHSDIISCIIPEIKPCIGFWQNNKYHKHDVYEHLLAVTDSCKTHDFIIKLAALLHDIGKPDSYTEDEEGHGHFYGHPEVSYKICKKVINRFYLDYSNEERLLNLVRYHDMVVTNNDKSVEKAYRKFGEKFLLDWVILKEADLSDHLFPKGKPDWFIDADNIRSIVQGIIAKEHEFTVKNLCIDGNLLKEGLGIPEGEQIGKILQALTEEVKNGKLVNETDTLILRAYELKDI